MAWSTRYVAPTITPWQGRANLPENACYFQQIRLLDLQATMPVLSQTTHAFALIGFCCDEGVRRNQGRIGAKEGPRAIREALAKMARQPATFTCYDAGDITCTDHNLEEAQQALGETIAILLQHDITPIVLGGGHELAYGHYQGIEKTCLTKKINTLGIVNFDAHFDMRPLLPHHQGSSGTPFLQIAEAHQATGRPLDYNCIGIQPTGNIPTLFETAKQYHTHFLLAETLHHDEKKVSVSFIERILRDNQQIYVSLCLDVFAAAFAPGVSAPQSFGLTPWQVLPLLRQLATSGKIISYDIAELLPHYDIDQRTAKLAAHFIDEIFHHHQGKK